MGSIRVLVITGAAAGMALAVPAAAEEATATMHAVSAEGIGEEIGTIQLADSAEGLTIEIDLNGLPPGAHGFHLHTEGSCEPGWFWSVSQAPLWPRSPPPTSQPPPSL